MGVRLFLKTCFYLISEGLEIGPDPLFGPLGGARDVIWGPRVGSWSQHSLLDSF